MLQLYRYQYQSALGERKRREEEKGRGREGRLAGIFSHAHTHSLFALENVYTVLQVVGTYILRAEASSVTRTPQWRVRLRVERNPRQSFHLSNSSPLLFSPFSSLSLALRSPFIFIHTITHTSTYILTHTLLHSDSWSALPAFCRSTVSSLLLCLSLSSLPLLSLSSPCARVHCVGTPCSIRVAHLPSLLFSSLLFSLCGATRRPSFSLGASRALFLHPAAWTRPSVRRQ